MKTIQIPEDVYDKLMEVSLEMRTQDNRCTAPPHFFQIRERKKVYDWGLNGEHQIFVCDELEIDSAEDLIEYYLDLKSDLSEDAEKKVIDEIRDLWERDFWFDLEDWAEENCPDLKRLSYSWEYVYHNSFFTAKACQDHIERKNYHYNQGTDYLNHGWRNPEMELIYNFLLSLSDGEGQK